MSRAVVARMTRNEEKGERGRRIETGRNFERVRNAVRRAIKIETQREA